MTTSSIGPVVREFPGGSYLGGMCYFEVVTNHGSVKYSVSTDGGFGPTEDQIYDSVSEARDKLVSAWKSFLVSTSCVETVAGNFSISYDNWKDAGYLSRIKKEDLFAFIRSSAFARETYKVTISRTLWEKIKDTEIVGAVMPEPEEMAAGMVMKLGEMSGGYRQTDGEMIKYYVDKDFEVDQVVYGKDRDASFY